MAELALTYNAAAVLTANTPPAQGNLNRYNAASGALSVTLAALSSCPDGTNFIVAKDPLDTTINAVTFTRNGSDTFSDGSTSLVLTRPGQFAWIQVVTVSGTKYWAVILQGEENPRGGITAITSQFAQSNSTASADIATTTLPAASLFAGSTYRVRLLGTIKVKATSGTYTITPSIQGTALGTFQMASQTSAEGPVSFSLEIYITVRSTGSSGTAIAHGWGHIKFATNTAVIISSTNTTATTINTTSAASSSVLKVAGQWATADANNAVALEIAEIERVL